MNAIIFDLDNTVMQGAALFHFGRGLYKRKFFETRDLAKFAWQQAWFRLQMPIVEGEELLARCLEAAEGSRVRPSPSPDFSLK